MRHRSVSTVGIAQIGGAIPGFSEVCEHKLMLDGEHPSGANCHQG
jgi:hypothetical protein